MPKVSERNRERPGSDCAICAASGRVPNRETRLAIKEVENGELFEYTGVIGPGMMTRILNGEAVRKSQSDSRKETPA